MADLKGRWAELCYGKKVKRRFDAVADDALSFSGSCDSEGIGSVVGDYDALVVGSDQVWNLRFYNASPVYFLDLSSSYRGLRLSDAACCGHAALPAACETRGSYLRWRNAARTSHPSFPGFW